MTYEIIYEPEIKALPTSSDKDNVADTINQSDNPVYKTVMPQYMYKPAWGFPRHQPLGLLKSLGKNVYASSVFKTIKDLIIDTEYDIVLKDGVDMTPELQKKIDKYKLFFDKPNPDPNETYSTFIRKLMDDIFKYDSGVINKIFNPLGELIQLRAVAGDTFKKNPDKHGYLDQRDDFIFDKAVTEGQTNALNDTQNKINNNTITNEFMNSASFQYYTNFIDRSAYFQFVNSVSSQIPTPFGKREICWLTTNPSTDNVYTNGSPLEDSIDIILTLVNGAKFNNDIYANSNMPEGILNATGASKKDLKKIKSQLSQSIHTPTDAFGMKRRIGGKMPIVNMENIDFIKLNLTSQEMEILNQQQWFTKILWMRFGINADEMGFTETSNKTTGETQTNNSKKKALKPFFRMLEECFTHEVLSEFEDGDLMRFKYDFYDPTEQKVIRDLQEQEIRMGINSSENIMDEEGIDKETITKHLQDKATFDSELNSNGFTNNFNTFNDSNKDKSGKDDKAETKAVSKTAIEKVMDKYSQAIEKRISEIIEE